MRDFAIGGIVALLLVVLFHCLIIEVKLEKIELNMKAVHYAGMLSNQGDGK